MEQDEIALLLTKEQVVVLFKSWVLHISQQEYKKYIKNKDGTMEIVDLVTKSYHKIINEDIY